jgi:hypothetical protein
MGQMLPSMDGERLSEWTFGLAGRPQDNAGVEAPTGTNVLVQTRGRTGAIQQVAEAPAA